MIRRPLLCLAFAATAAAPVRAADFKVVLVSISSPVKPGQIVALTLQAEPGAQCTGRRQGPDRAELVLVLPRQQARADGQVLWKWEIAGNYPAGSRSVVVTCSKEEQSATLETEFEVR